MKVWPIDPLVPRNLRLEVPEKLPQGLPCRRVVPEALVVPTNLESFLRLCIWFWKCFLEAIQG
jgi:hypothetical protein